jgi:hypothetical protein
MSNRSSRNIAFHIQNKAKKAKALFSRSLSDKKTTSSDRLKSRLKRRSISEPSKATNRFVEDFSAEVDRTLRTLNSGDSYISFEDKLKELEREANIEDRTSSDDASDLSSLDSLDAVQFNHKNWKLTDMDPAARKKVSRFGRSAFASLFTSKSRRRKNRRNKKM